MGSLQKSKEQGLTTPLQTTDLPYFQKLNKKATEAPTVLDFSSPHWIDPICQTLTNHENLLIILGLNPAIELYAGDQRIPSVKWKQCLSAAASSLCCNHRGLPTSSLPRKPSLVIPSFPFPIPSLLSLSYLCTVYVVLRIEPRVMHMADMNSITDFLSSKAASFLPDFPTSA